MAEYPVAVLGNGQLQSSYGMRPHTTYTNIQDVAHLAFHQFEPLRAIWLLPGSDVEQLARDPAWWTPRDPEKWNAFATGANNGNLSGAGIRRIAQGWQREATIHSECVNRWRMPEGLTASGVLVHVAAYEKAMQGDAKLSPASTALALLKRLCDTKQRAEWLTPLSNEMIKRTLPRAGAKAPGHVNPDPIDGEYVHVLDRRAAFMASSLRNFGEGDPLHLLNVDEKQAQAILNERMTGLWRVTATRTGAVDFRMPSPWSTHSDDPIDEWFYTPQLALASRLGWAIAIHEGYFWPKCHDTLVDWVRAMWNARKLHRDTSTEPMIKASFNMARGIFARWPGEREKVQFYHRPDFDGLMSAENYLRMGIKIAACQGVNPGYLKTFYDDVAWVSNEPDPYKAVPQFFTTSADAMGAFRHVATFAGSEARRLIQMARDGVRVGDMNREIERLRHAHSTNVQ